MAQLLLTAVSGVGSAIGKIGLGSILTKTIASTAAGFAASHADRLIFGPQKRSVEGPRIDSIHVQASTEGAPIYRVYGRARIAGQIIWAANFKETSTETTESAGGKGGPSVEVTQTTYSYSASFAVGLCDGVIDRIARVWADGRALDLSRATMRVYRGTESQGPDPLIEAVESAAPAYRGLAYVVFEDLALADFGNRLPQLSFEIEKGLGGDDPESLENALTSVTMIPGSGEFVYGSTKVFRTVAEGETAYENVNNNSGLTDFEASLENLQAAAPNLEAVSLVVSWFGDDLRAGACSIKPGVEHRLKTTTPYSWSVSGVQRPSAYTVSEIDGAPVYGGTPSDKCVIEAIKSMNAKGLAVMMHPFILMDVPPGNGKPDPYGGGEQAAFPWRGRITVGANDRTSAASSDISAFFGTAAPGHFSISGETVNYSGPNEWSFRRFILHQAYLCKAAGGVESFIIGSEMRGVTWARDGSGAYPAVAALVSLAADVRSVLGASVKISYGADWSEYFGHQPADGSGDVRFHLDVLWADANIDFIGIDNYMPLADWPSSGSNLDADAGFDGPLDVAYLQSNVEGGEGFAWYYASEADRAAQIRTPITDSVYTEPWVYRYKDIRSWWSNAHHDRIGGVRNAQATAWVPGSKPFRFTETGCGAIDRGANQPNVFLDPKSAESAKPYWSTGARDELAQRRFLEALHAYWRDTDKNPTATLYSGKMVDADRFYVYAWDARPFPFFPGRSDIWGDTENWRTGHWLNGRLGRAPLGALIEALCLDGGFSAVDAEAVSGSLTGYVVDRPMTARDALDPLASVFQFDAIEALNADTPVIRFQPRNAPPVHALTADDLTTTENADDFVVGLTDESDTPTVVRLGYIDADGDYEPAVADASDPSAAEARISRVDAPIIIDPATADALAGSVLADAWVMRETARLTLPPSRLALEPGDIVSVDMTGIAGGGPSRSYRVIDIVDREAREISAVRVQGSVYDLEIADGATALPEITPHYGPPSVAFMDLPLLREQDNAAAPYIAAYAKPWPGALSVFKTVSGGTATFAGTILAAATMGRLATALPVGFSGRWDRRTVRVRLNSGHLASRPSIDVFSGANAIAVETASGSWEVLQFEQAVLQEDGAYLLSGLLRGQRGTEAAAASGAAIDAQCVILNAAVMQPDIALGARGVALDWTVGPAQDPETASTYAELTASPAALALQPLSPVHFNAQDTSAGLSLSWIRRTRYGDTWDGEPPLGETVERYQLIVKHNGADKRSVEVSTPGYLYDNASITADFGASAPPSGVSYEVRQWSDSVGWGAPAVLSG
ncbi:MAG: glycoside hydrolase TIM-barrel-like domain-containing protein [Pseudomonadota bacterium]